TERAYVCLLPLAGGHGTVDKPSVWKNRSRGCILRRSTKTEGAILSSLAVRALDYPGHRWVSGRPADNPHQHDAAMQLPWVYLWRLKWIFMVSIGQPPGKKGWLIVSTSPSRV